MWLHCSQHFLVGSDLQTVHSLCVAKYPHQYAEPHFTNQICSFSYCDFFSQFFIIHFRKACYIMIVCIIGVLQFNHMAFSYMVYPNQSSRTAYETGSAHLEQETTGSIINNDQNNMHSVLLRFLEAQQEKFHAVFFSISLNASCRGLSYLFRPFLYRNSGTWQS